MVEGNAATRVEHLSAGFREVRARTEALASPLTPEDQTVQSMPDVSPTKWHRAHTTWFFETFLLEPALRGYQAFHPAYRYLFNSYYEAVGTRHPRPARGLISRPGVNEVARYRHHVDRAMATLLDANAPSDLLDLVELGLHHEQQHQELLLMDAKHVLSCNPLLPTYAPSEGTQLRRPAEKPGWIEHAGGAVEVGAQGPAFTFDNERPRHIVQLAPFALAERPVTCGEWAEFIDDGGYERPELWLSDGWAAVQQLGWSAPLYWSFGWPPWSEAESSLDEDTWVVFTLYGSRPIDPGEPVCHVSYYEADAFARWSGARLPTEAEWETVAAPAWQPGGPGQAPDELPWLHPRSVARRPGFLGDVWEWTASAYAAYPGFRPAAGAVGEYNGKFMVNQYVLRGGCCATPPGHARPTYRNFFPAGARWAFSGLRLARDL